VETIDWFATAKKLVAYAGLAPSVRASGERGEYGRITKQGRSEIRAVWVQAAPAVGCPSGEAQAAAGRPGGGSGASPSAARSRRTATLSAIP
jgi:transposase